MFCEKRDSERWRADRLAYTLSGPASLYMMRTARALEMVWNKGWQEAKAEIEIVAACQLPRPSCAGRQSIIKHFVQHTITVLTAPCDAVTELLCELRKVAAHRVMILRNSQHLL